MPVMISSHGRAWGMIDPSIGKMMPMGGALSVPSEAAKATAEGLNRKRP